MTAVVTGGAGFVGRAVVAAFLARGTPVTVLDRAPHPRTRSVVAELPDAAAVAMALAGADGVVHLAARTSVLSSVADPVGTYRANVAATAELLEACRVRGVPRFVLASSGAVVGDVGRARVDETAPLRPLTPYGATKAAAEALLAGYAGAYGLAGTALRLTNVYGAGMAGKDGLVVRALRAARDGGRVQVRGDGRQLRDYVHVDDVVAAVLAAWDRRATGTAVVGAGRSVSVLELLDLVRAVTGRPVPAEHVPAVPGEVPAVVVDVRRARELLGWAPAVPLREGLAVAWADVRDG